MTRARTLSSVLTVNTSFDANTLFIDVDNNRIGINNGAPTDELTVTGNVSFSGVITGNGAGLSSINVASVSNVTFVPANSTLVIGTNFGNLDTPIQLLRVPTGNTGYINSSSVVDEFGSSSDYLFDLNSNGAFIEEDFGELALGNGIVEFVTLSTNTAYTNAVSAANTLAFNFAANAYGNAVSAANTLAFDFAANAYANAVSYANTVSDTAYTNSVSAANTLAFNFAANAYANAVSQANTLAFNFAANAYANATSYTDTAISNLVNSAPSALDTLFELANALGNDANFSTNVLTGIGNAYTNAVAQANTLAFNFAANAYANSVAYANTISDTAYTNAVSAANTLAFDFAANAYANAIAYSSNADNITSGTLDSARFQANVDVTVQLSVGNTTVNSVVNSTSINTNTIVVGNVEQTQTNLQVDPAGTAFLNALIYG